MGALVAAVSKNRADVSGSVTKMLETLSHRGSDAFGVASSQKVSIKSSLEELGSEVVKSHALIGYNLARFLPKDKPQPVHNRNFALVFDGRIFPTPLRSEAKFLIEALDRDKEDQLIQRFSGDYAFAVAKKEAIVVGRDAIGACPLYFGENNDVCAVASERKALWRIGIEKTDSFPPGKLAILNEEGFSFKAAMTIGQPKLQRLSIEAAAQQLRPALLRSMQERVSDVKEVAVAFSGGLDSTIVALLSRLCNVDAHLICVSLEGQKETDFARHAAKALDLPIHTVVYSSRDVEVILPKILWQIEEANSVNASIAIPISWAAEQATKLGLRVMMTGQGGDELFGGYHRYAEEYAERGLIGLQRRLYKDVVASHKSNYQRDNKVCAAHKVELRMPFVDWNVIKLALSFPPDLKLASSQDTLRKRVLREMAKKMGTPDFIAEKPKKAIQYTTGTMQAMRKLAKKEGFSLREYVEKSFSKACKRLR